MIRRLFCYIEYNEIKKSDKFNPDNYDLSIWQSSILRQKRVTQFS